MANKQEPKKPQEEKGWDREKGTGSTKGLSAEDRIEREVRRRVANKLASAGVDHGRLEMEVLYWLPESFCRLYMRMVEDGLALDMGVSSGLGAAAGDEGQIKARVGTGPQGNVKKGGGNLWTRESGAHASGAGKRYRGSPVVVKDQELLELKGNIDRSLGKLARLMDEAGVGKRKKKRAEGEGVGKGKTHGDNLQTRGDNLQTHGDNLGPTSGQDTPPAGVGIEGREIQAKEGKDGKLRRMCGTCGKMMSSDWAICPFSHA